MYHVSAAYNAAQNMMNHPRQPDQSTRSGVEALQQKVERQELLIQTLLMVLLEKKVIYEDEFKEWLAYVDDLDGVRDGKVREDKSPVQCPSCGRNTPRTYAKCQYCGEEMDMSFLARRPE